MQATVLGATGFIGGHLAARLSEQGHDVWCPPRSNLHSLDHSDLGHVFYCIGEDAVATNPCNAADAHITQLANVLKRRSFASLTYLSSTRVYLGADSAHEGSELRVLPSDDGALFGTMKMAAEKLCFAFDNPVIRVVRLSSVIGFAPNGNSLIPTLIKDALLRGRMNLTISPQSSRDYIAVEDVVDILPRIAVDGKRRCYNVASGVNVRLAEIVRSVAGEFASECDWRENAPTILFPVIDTTRARTEFFFTPRSPLDALISACAEFRRRLSSKVDAAVPSVVR